MMLLVVRSASFDALRSLAVCHAKGFDDSLGLKGYRHCVLSVHRFLTLHKLQHDMISVVREMFPFSSSEDVAQLHRLPPDNLVLTSALDLPVFK